ncbi:MAG: hypothetical protein L3J17_15885 [Candidatus Jettenia sp.]|nr:MAG: hypothetical protein L3J17_15885 [Candidatus Jettenia sp.]
MIKYIDLSKSKKYELPALLDSEAQIYTDGKGWSFSNIYFLRELRDVYLIVKHKQFNNSKEYYDLIKKNVRYENKEWDDRRILEQLNALINFGLINRDYNVKKLVFQNAELGAPLSIEDLIVFKDIFFNYFRFKEIISWFIGSSTQNREKRLEVICENYLKENSKPLFVFQSKGRFSDSFIYELKDNTDVYHINEQMRHLMRFWDVFVKWGSELNLIEKFNLKKLDISLINNDKSITCVYFKNESDITLDLFSYIKANFKSKHIYIPMLIFKIAMEYRFPIDKIKNYIIWQYLVNKELMSLERTSEIFIKREVIKEKEIILFPKYKDSFISHIFLR